MSVDPELLKHYKVIAGYHAETAALQGMGINAAFEYYSQKMIEDYGEEIKPELRTLFNSALYKYKDIKRMIEKNDTKKLSKKNEQPDIKEVPAVTTSNIQKETTKSISIWKLPQMPALFFCVLAFIASLFPPVRFTRYNKAVTVEKKYDYIFNNTISVNDKYNLQRHIILSELFVYYIGCGLISGAYYLIIKGRNGKNKPNN